MVGLELAVHRNRHARPLVRAAAQRRVFQHVAVLLLGHAADDDPGFGARILGRDRRVDRHGNAHERRHVPGADAVLVQVPAAPQRAGNVLEDFGLDFLPAHACAEVPVDNVRLERLRQVHKVLVAGVPRNDDVRILHELENERDRPGRGRRQPTGLFTEA